MILGFDTVEAITCGAKYVNMEADGIHFYRLNQRQKEYYINGFPGFYSKGKCCAGIKLHFKTNSRSLKLDLTLQKTTGRSYGAVEVLVDGVRIGNINNFENQELPADYAALPFPCGRVEKTFDLGEGEKTVCILFPRLISIILHEVSLDDGAAVEAVKAEKKALVFGDSITQGFDCLWPSSHYVHQLCDKLDADEYNNAIGGDKFAPASAACRDDFAPDYVIVGYGTNDWRNGTVALFQENCREFFAVLNRNFPGVPVIVITPVWRADLETAQNVVDFGPIHEIEDYIRQVAAPYPNVTVIRGFELIPHETRMYGDLRLHPNDEGFAHYGKNLLCALQQVGFLK